MASWPGGGLHGLRPFCSVRRLTLASLTSSAEHATLFGGTGHALRGTEAGFAGDDGVMHLMHSISEFTL
jgi:hypothetical protein